MRRGRNPASARAIDELRAGLGDDAAAMAFAEAVLAQAGRPLGRASDPAREISVARSAAGILRAAREPDAAAHPGAGVAAPDRPSRPGGGPGEMGQTGRPDGAIHPETTLEADPLLLAAFFQNVDLLYDAGAPEATRVAGWVMAALDRASRRRRPGGRAPDGRA